MDHHKGLYPCRLRIELAEGEEDKGLILLSQGGRGERGEEVEGEAAETGTCAVTLWKYLCNFMAAAAAGKSLQSCSTLCDPIDGSPRGSPIPGILQARTLEWVAISFSNT